jgi:malate/lactate dehydrogenase
MVAKEKRRLGIIGVGKNTESIGFGLVKYLLDNNFVSSSTPNEFYLYNGKSSELKNRMLFNTVSEWVSGSKQIQARINADFQHLTHDLAATESIKKWDSLKRKIENPFQVEENRELNCPSFLDYGVLKFFGCNDLKTVVENSDAVVIAFDANKNWRESIEKAPKKKRNEMRENFLPANLEGIVEIAEKIKQCDAANTHIVVVTNPVCELSYALHKISGLDMKQITGYSVVDSNRLKKAIIDEAKHIFKEPYVEGTYIVGRHDADTKKEKRSMALYSAIKINRTPFDDIKEFKNLKSKIKKDSDNRVVDEFLAHDKTTTTIIPSLADVVQSILSDNSKVHPMATYFEDENLFLVWPVKYLNRKAYPVINFSTKDTAETCTSALVKRAMTAEESKLFDEIAAGLKKKVKYIEAKKFRLPAPMPAAFRYAAASALVLAATTVFYFAFAPVSGLASRFLMKQKYNSYSEAVSKIKSLADSERLSAAEEGCVERLQKLKNETNPMLFQLRDSLSAVCKEVEEKLVMNGQVIGGYEKEIGKVTALANSKKFSEAQKICSRIKPELQGRIKNDYRFENLLEQAAASCSGIYKSVKKDAQEKKKEDDNASKVAVKEKNQGKKWSEYAPFKNIAAAYLNWFSLPVKNFLIKHEYSKYSDDFEEIKSLAYSGKLVSAGENCTENLQKLKTKAEKNQLLVKISNLMASECSDVEERLKENAELIRQYNIDINTMVPLFNSRDFAKALDLCAKIQPELENRIKIDDRFKALAKQSGAVCQELHKQLEIIHGEQIAEYRKSYEIIFSSGYESDPDSALQEKIFQCSWMKKEVDIKEYPELREDMKNVRQRCREVETQAYNRVVSLYEEGKKSIIRTSNSLSWQGYPFAKSNLFCNFFEEHAKDSPLLQEVRQKHGEIRDKIMELEGFYMQQEVNSRGWWDPYKRAGEMYAVNQFIKSETERIIENYQDPYFKQVIPDWQK